MPSGACAEIAGSIRPGGEKRVASGSKDWAGVMMARADGRGASEKGRDGVWGGRLGQGMLGHCSRAPPCAGQVGDGSAVVRCDSRDGVWESPQWLYLLAKSACLLPLELGTGGDAARCRRAEGNSSVASSHKLPAGRSAARQRPPAGRGAWTFQRPTAAAPTHRVMHGRGQKLMRLRHAPSGFVCQSRWQVPLLRGLPVKEHTGLVEWASRGFWLPAVGGPGLGTPGGNWSLVGSRWVIPRRLDAWAALFTQTPIAPPTVPVLPQAPWRRARPLPTPTRDPPIPRRTPDFQWQVRGWAAGEVVGLDHSVNPAGRSRCYAVCPSKSTRVTCN
jgi:hypothetical protein